mgnify:CR=1 FL=1
MRRSKATFPVFDDLITQNEFLLLVTLVALQASDPKTRNPDPEIAILEDLQWLLAYWRTDANDDGRDDRAEMFFYGRKGFSEMTMEEIQGEIIGQLTDGWYEVEDDGTAAVSLGNVNDFLRWAWEKFIPWEPEPVVPTLSRKEYIQTVMDFSVTLSQFIDHFEDFQVRRIMQYLMDSFTHESVVWYTLSQSPAIDIEYEGFGTTLIFSQDGKRVMNLHIDDWTSFHVTME